MKTKKLYSVLLIAFLSALAAYGQNPDSIFTYFAHQLETFPQEKIYLHIDKPYYMVGEKIWFRAHTVNAATHLPATASRYVYVELIDAQDSVKVRLKVRPDSTGVKHGSLIIPPDLPTGDYELRAYTHFMLNAGEPYFFRRNVQICSPQESAKISQAVAGEPHSNDKPTASLSSDYALQTIWKNDRLVISLDGPAVAQDTFFLVAHTRGLVHFVARWAPKQTPLALPKAMFPSGVLQFLLLDKHLNLLKDRFVYVDNDDQAQVAFSTNRANYPARSLVECSVGLTDPSGEPLTGNFSVAVTADREVIQDTTENILTDLLRTSDVRGDLENAVWKRYDVPSLLHGTIARPTEYLEMGPSITGRVKWMWGKRSLEGRAVTSIIQERTFEQPLYPALDPKFANNTEAAITDKDGRFEFTKCEWPDSTRFLISIIPEKGKKKPELVLDEVKYPGRTLPPLSLQRQSVESAQLDNYLKKAEQQYVIENGMSVTYLREVVVSGYRKSKHQSNWYRDTDATLTQEEIDKLPPSATLNIISLLRRIPGIWIQTYEGKSVPVITRNMNNSLLNNRLPLLVVDDVPWRDITMIHDVEATDVAQIDVLKGTRAAVFGSEGVGGVISIHTKRGDGIRYSEIQPFHIKAIKPLGYHTVSPFYAPNYDTPEAKRSPKPDLRTTIAWQPFVQTDKDGRATFRFYSADAPDTYTVIIEGIADDGRIIHKEVKISRTKQPQ